MLKIDLQLFGGRGSVSGGGLPTGGGGGGGGISIDSVRNMTSAKNIMGYGPEVEEVMRAAKEISDRYGVVANDIQVAQLSGPNAGYVMAYYDEKGNVAINSKYFNNAKIEGAYERCVKDGFHPSKGNKTGMEATTAHELGHLLTAQAAQRAGHKDWHATTAPQIVNRAVKASGAGNAQKLAKAISGYATKNYAECIAEAFADVYCNGNKAKRESQAVVKELNSYFGGKGL